MKKLAGLIVFCLIAALPALAQKQDKPLIQFSGMVRNADSTQAIVPYTNIVNLSDKDESDQSNYQGYFSFVVHERDTVRFTCVGYGAVDVVIPAGIKSGSYTIPVLMKPTIRDLPAFKVFPWATTEEFTRDFLSMRIADDDLAIAHRNTSLSSLLNLERTLPRNGDEIYNIQDFHNSMVNSHVIVNTLFNPFAWGTLIKSISEGDKSRAADNTTNNNAVTTGTIGN